MHKFTREPVLGTEPIDGTAIFGFSIDDVFIFDPYSSDNGFEAADPVETYGITEEDAQALDVLNKFLGESSTNAVWHVLEELRNETSTDPLEIAVEELCRNITLAIGKYLEHHIKEKFSCTK